MTVRPIVIVLHQLGSGGATKAVLDQAGMFAGAGRDVTVVTFDDSPTQSERIRELVGSGTLPSSVRVLNIHEEHALKAERPPARSPQPARLRKLLEWGQATYAAASQASKRFVEKGEDAHGAYRRAFDGTGELLDFTRLDADGKIIHINYYENALRVRRDSYVDGVPHLRTVFNADDIAIRELFLTRDGFCYAQRWIDPETSRGKGVFVVDRGTGAVARHSGLPAWHVAWLQEIVDSFAVAPFVVAESSSAITKVMGLRPDSAVRMAMMHNSHLTAPFEIDSPLRNDYEAAFARLEELDSYLVLSERQRRDMVQRIGGDDVMTVVPNVLKFPEVGTVQKDGHLVSVVSRLAPQKSLHEAIHAFKAVLDDFPAARLEIYGSGSSKGELQKLVDELGLGSSIVFKGRTKEPLAVMARSVCTLSTSEWEALPLSIAESLGVGTPVVAYDCLYGPSTLIKDGQTGFVVPRRDRHALSGAILTLLKDPSRAQEMGAAGRADVKLALDRGTVLSRWQDAFDHAEGRFAKRIA